MNTYDFVKNDPKVENMDLFQANFYGAWHKKILTSQSRENWGLGTKN